MAKSYDPVALYAPYNKDPNNNMPGQRPGATPTEAIEYVKVLVGLAFSFEAEFNAGKETDKGWADFDFEKYKSPNETKRFSSEEAPDYYLTPRGAAGEGNNLATYFWQDREGWLAWAMRGASTNEAGWNDKVMIKTGYKSGTAGATYGYKPEFSFNELYFMWFVTDLIRRLAQYLPSVDGDGLFATDKADMSPDAWEDADFSAMAPFGENEIQYIFSGWDDFESAFQAMKIYPFSDGRGLLDTNQKPILTGDKQWQQFIIWLLIHAPGLFINSPFYNDYLADGMALSFDEFDKQGLERCKQTFQKDDGSAWTIEAKKKQLLLWNTTNATNYLDGVPATATDADGVLYTADSKILIILRNTDGAHSPEFTNWRTDQVKISDGSLPMTKDGTDEQKKTYTNKILDLTLGNVERISDLEFQASGVGKGSVPYNAVPGYLQTGPATNNVGDWLFFQLLKPTPKKDKSANLEAWVRIYYYRFIQAVVEDDRDVFQNPNETTLEQKWEAAMGRLSSDPKEESLTNQAVRMIAINHENLLRVAYWKAAHEKLNDPANFKAAGGKQAIEEEILKNKNAQAPDPIPDPPDPDDDLEVVAVANRQKFYKECALLLNAHTLKTILHASIQKRLPDTSSRPFHGRLHMLRTAKDQDRLLNDLMTDESVAQFFQLSPAEVTAMVPRLRLYRVRNKKQGMLEETEFIFPSVSDPNRTSDPQRGLPSFCETPFDKGDGVGVKSFSLSFNGTNPAESRKDIQAELSLYFQSFNDFIRDRKSSNGDIYKYVDLILQPDYNNQTGTKPIHRDQYDPAYYRIRVDVGYAPDSVPDRLASAVKITNNSFYLNAVDHNIQVANDGSVTVNLSYQAYAETALKSWKSDALATPQLIQRRIENIKQLVFLLESKACNPDEIQQIKYAMTAQSNRLRDVSLRSILSRLEKRKRIYKIRIDREEARHYRKYGYFKKGAPIIPFDDVFFEEGAIVQAGTIEDLTWDDVNNDWMTNQITDNNYFDNDDTIIQFFFFSDLLEIISDSMYDPDNPSEPLRGMENVKFILGSFDFNPYQSNSLTDQAINIGEIPIDVEFFTRWFVDNIITQGKTREAFPIMTFIRNFANNLLSPSLLGACLNRNIKKNLSFHTTTLPAVSNNKSVVDPIGVVSHYPKGVEDNISFVMETEELKTRDALPLSQQSEVSIEQYYNYVILHTEGSTLTKAGRGKYSDDIGNGRFHVSIGSDRGIVKSISFAKADMQYVREARFQSNGIDGLLQMSAVYTATIEMYGNTIFYPGMEVFINPYGIGGTMLGSPTKSNSIANKLGFGGYHTITSVKTILKPGSYSTTIEAMWYFSGNPQEDKMDQQGYVSQPSPDAEVSSDFCQSIIRQEETMVSRLQKDPTWEGDLVGTASPQSQPGVPQGRSSQQMETASNQQASALPPLSGGGPCPPEPAPDIDPEILKLTEDILGDDATVDVTQEGTTVESVTVDQKSNVDFEGELSQIHFRDCDDPSRRGLIYYDSFDQEETGDWHVMTFFKEGLLMGSMYQWAGYEDSMQRSYMELTDGERFYYCDEQSAIAAQSEIYSETTPTEDAPGSDLIYEDPGGELIEVETTNQALPENLQSQETEKPNGFVGAAVSGIEAVSSIVLTALESEELEAILSGEEPIDPRISPEDAEEEIDPRIVPDDLIEDLQVEEPIDSGGDGAPPDIPQTDHGGYEDDSAMSDYYRDQEEEGNVVSITRISPWMTPEEITAELSSKGSNQGGGSQRLSGQGQWFSYGQAPENQGEFIASSIAIDELEKQILMAAEKDPTYRVKQSGQFGIQNASGERVHVNGTFVQRKWVFWKETT